MVLPLRVLTHGSWLRAWPSDDGVGGGRTKSMSGGLVTGSGNIMLGAVGGIVQMLVDGWGSWEGGRR